MTLFLHLSDQALTGDGGENTRTLIDADAISGVVYTPTRR